MKHTIALALVALLTVPAIAQAKPTNPSPTQAPKPRKVKGTQCHAHCDANMKRIVEDYCPRTTIGYRDYVTCVVSELSAYKSCKKSCDGDGRYIGFNPNSSELIVSDEQVCELAAPLG